MPKVTPRQRGAQLYQNLRRNRKDYKGVLSDFSILLYTTDYLDEEMPIIQVARDCSRKLFIDIYQAGDESDDSNQVYNSIYTFLNKNGTTTTDELMYLFVWLIADLIKSKKIQKVGSKIKMPNYDDN